MVPSCTHRDIKITFIRFVARVTALWCALPGESGEEEEDDREHEDSGVSTNGQLDCTVHRLVSRTEDIVMRVHFETNVL